MQNSNQWLLATGAIAGTVLAATGLFKVGDNVPTVDAVAIVNDISIGKTDYLAVLNLLADDKRAPLTSSDRQQVLERILEEELLVERGLEIGLAQSDPSVRKAIVSALIDSVTREAAAHEPDEDELEQFYRDNNAYFTPPERLQVRRMVFREDNDRIEQESSSRQRADSAYKALAHASFDEVSRLYSDPDTLGLPKTSLPPHKLSGYLGPTQSEVVMTMQPGQYSAPLSDGNGFTILLLVDRVEDKAQELHSIRNVVSKEYKRRAGDAALREYLDMLRAQATIELDDAFLQELERVSP
tara:strand:- start:92 stop:985 length:894 start_codon:yes stop_codon:yes gene_type:complete